MFGMVAEKPNGETYNLIRPDWDRPAPSITLVRGATPSSDIGDFAGIWLRMIRDGEMLNKTGESPLPLNEKGIAARAAYDPRESQYKDCLPLDMPSLLTVPYPIEFRVSDDRVEIYHEYYAVPRRFVTDGMSRPSHETDQYGVSSARVAGNELTIVTDMFPPSSAGLGADFDSFGKGANIPASERKRLTETYRLLNDGAILELSLTVEDPEYLTEPFDTTMIWARQPEGTPIYDFDCDVEIARRSTSNAIVD